MSRNRYERLAEVAQSTRAQIGLVPSSFKYTGPDQGTAPGMHSIPYLTLVTQTLESAGGRPTRRCVLDLLNPGRGTLPRIRVRASARPRVDFFIG